MSCSATIYTIPIPGPQGVAGADGTNGTNGENAWTLTTASFDMPAELATVDVDVESADPFQIGMVVYVYVSIAAVGYFEITNIAGTTLTLKNLEDTTTGAYADNSAPGATFTSGAKVSVAGMQGPAGVTPATAFLIANNLSEGTPGTMRTNLGLGSAALATDGVAANNIPHIDATFTAGDSVFATALGLQTKTAAATRTALSLVVGTNVQAYDATLQSLSSLGTVTDRIAYTTALDTWAEATFTAFARTLVANNSAADARVDLDVLNGYGLLASSDAIDLNSATTDTAVTIGATRYLIDNITLESPSAAVTTATMGLFTAAGGGGTTLCADQALSGSLTATTKVMNLVKQAIVDSDSRTDGTLYIRVGTAEGSACTVNVKIYGWKFA